MRDDTALIRSQVEALRLSHPDIMQDEELFQLALESETEVTEFLGRLLERIDEDKEVVLGLDALIDAYEIRLARHKARVQAMRMLILGIMQTCDIKKLKLIRATLSVRNGVPKVIITDESAVPENCFRVKRTPNLTLIKELIDQGVPIPGATLSNAEPTLMVT